VLIYWPGGVPRLSRACPVPPACQLPPLAARAPVLGRPRLLQQSRTTLINTARIVRGTAPHLVPRSRQRLRTFSYTGYIWLHLTFVDDRALKALLLG